jgi:nicotinamide-nucleotide amidase
MTTAIILSIGDELVLGQTIDTNSAWLSQRLASIGVRILAHQTVPDDQRAIEDALTSAARCDALIVSGGLGPTEDDLTRQALAAVLNVPLELNQAALQTLTGWFSQLKREMAPSNRIQAMFPRGTTPIENTCGTAPGIRAELNAAGVRCDIFIMPGVPKEMKAMFERDVLPTLRQRSGGAAIVSRTLHTFGAGESTIGERLGNLMDRRRNPSVGTTVSGGVVSVRVNAYFESQARAESELERTVAECRERLGDLVYGQDDQTLQLVVAALLKTSGKKVATAESCTGGLLATYLTDIPGSSAYFTHGWVTYANEAKADQLGVSRETLAQHGAVSEPVVREMAAGARQRAHSDAALAVSGVAGPDGGTAAKPVGMVCIALATTDGVEARTFRFPGDREFIRDRSAKMALTMLRFWLLGKPLPF